MPFHTNTHCLVFFVTQPIIERQDYSQISPLNGSFNLDRSIVPSCWVRNDFRNGFNTNRKTIWEEAMDEHGCGDQNRTGQSGENESLLPRCHLFFMFHDFPQIKQHAKSLKIPRFRTGCTIARTRKDFDDSMSSVWDRIFMHTGRFIFR